MFHRERLTISESIVKVWTYGKGTGFESITFQQSDETELCMNYGPDYELRTMCFQSPCASPDM